MDVFGIQYSKQERKYELINKQLYLIYTCTTTYKNGGFPPLPSLV